MSDFLVDLHSAGTKLDAPTLVGYTAVEGEVGRISREAAHIFGAPVVWEHPDVPCPGRTTSVAKEKGIPNLYTETRGGARLFKEALECYEKGIINVMKYLEMLPGDTKRGRIKYNLYGEGNTDTDMVRVPTSGFLVSYVNVLDRVKTGDLLGKILDPFGEVLGELKAPYEGCIVFKRATPVIYSGEGAYLLAREHK